MGTLQSYLLCAATLRVHPRCVRRTDNRTWWTGHCANAVPSSRRQPLSQNGQEVGLWGRGRTDNILGAPDDTDRGFASQFCNGVARV
jgi:hypothetical protein